MNSIVKDIQNGNIKTLKEIKKRIIEEENIKWGKKLHRIRATVFELTYINTIGIKVVRFAFSEKTLENIEYRISDWTLVKIVKRSFKNFYANKRNKKQIEKVIYETNNYNNRNT